MGAPWGGGPIQMFTSLPTSPALGVESDEIWVEVKRFDLV